MNWEDYAVQIDDALDKLSQENDAPTLLSDAMRYSLLGGGKRIRGSLLLAGCALVGGSIEEALVPACAVEMIHCFSLIHDDLPSMDNDDIRRGKPANHIVYGVGMATLAGDALFALAFQRMLEHAAKYPEHIDRHVAAMTRIARASGISGIAGGQCLDLSSEQEQHSWNAALLEEIHLRKTAALMAAPVAAGLILGGATEAEVCAGNIFGLVLGQAFQIADDLLDESGMDAKRGKLTWPGFHGIEAARKAVTQLTEEAHAALGLFGEAAASLHALVDRVLKRG